MYIHNDDLTSLREQVPKECLPKEYGGEAGSIQENWSKYESLYFCLHRNNSPKRFNVKDENECIKHSTALSTLLQ
jgi:hypothetical protein